jgi:hypothetical protein
VAAVLNDDADVLGQSLHSVRSGAFMRLFKSGQAGASAAGYSWAMSIVRDDGDERQTRVDRMIEEFRKAQSRRLAKAVTDVHAEAAAAGSMTTPRTSH